MGLVFHLTRRELTEHVRSMRYLVVCLLCLGTFPLSAVFLARDYAGARAEYDRLRMAHHQEILAASDVNELDELMVVDRPANPLSAYVRGARGELADAVRLRVAPGGTLQVTQSYDGRLTASPFEAADVTFLVGSVLSLLVLALSYDAIAGERDEGTLKLLLSYSVPRDTVLAAKWLGGYLAIAVPFLIVSAAALVLGIQVGGLGWSASEMIAYAAIAAIGLLYLGVMQSLALVVSVTARSSKQAMAVCLLVWVVLALVVPNMSPYVARALRPAPSREAVLVAVGTLKAAAAQEWSRTVEQWAAKRRQPTAGASWRDDPDMAVRAQRHQEQLDTGVRRLEEDQRTRLLAQADLAALVARCSPAGAYRIGTMDLAGVGPEEEQTYAEAVQRYSRTWSQYVAGKQAPMFEYINGQIRKGHFYWTLPEALRHPSFSDYPDFGYVIADLTTRVQQAVADVALLALWSVGLMLLAWARFCRRSLV